MIEVTNTQVSNMFAFMNDITDRREFLKSLALEMHGLTASTKVAYAPFKTVKLINYDPAIHNI